MKRIIGIVGTGIMGHGVAVNFLKKGWTVYMWNRSTDSMSDLITIGGITCTSPREVSSKADITFEFTANDDSSRAVWLGENGIFSGADQSKILIASATLSIPWIDELIQYALKKSFTFLDIPITGGRQGAESGTLTMLAGGSESVVSGLSDVFSAIARKTYYFGNSGSGMRYKLILNFLQALHIAGFGEAMRLAKEHDLDLRKVAEALSDRPGGVLTTIAKERYFSDPDPVTFTITNMVKDLTYAKGFAGALDTPLLDDVLTLYSKAVSQGHGNKDWTIVNTLEDNPS